MGLDGETARYVTASTSEISRDRSPQRRPRAKRPLAHSLAFDVGATSLEREAYERIFIGYSGAVYRLATRALQDHHEAEDVTQEVFTAVLRALPKHLRTENSEALRAWLRTTTTREVIRCCRKRGLVTNAPLAGPFHDSRGEDDSVERVEGWLHDPRLAVAVEQLPRRQREALALRFKLDLTRKQTAIAMQCTPKAVKELHREALARLKRQLDSGGRVP